ncbi:MAG: hypothetical protein ABJH28_07930 [Paraglaciecola sp.]|uniref:hypothetical protein n=1 Tax=Paraglaciecola sp. TaxID=1920173 RepID=UPI003264D986
MITHEDKINALISSSERLFRLYFKQCTAPDLDTLFNFLNALHSFQDKFEKAGLGSFYEVPEFIALKTIRNLFHHHVELMSEVRIIPAQDLPPINTDLLYLCLVHRRLIEEALLRLPKNHKAQGEAMTKAAFNWHGEIIDINPCIFNFMVEAYEQLRRNDIELSTEEFEGFPSSYTYEEGNGYSHKITGTLFCHASSIEKVLEKVFSPIK